MSLTKNEPKNTLLSRRRALKALTIGGGAWASMASRQTRAQVAQPAPASPGTDQYWNQLRKREFDLADDRVFLNTGSLGVIPKPVLHAVIDGLRRQARFDSDDPPRWGYETLDAERAEMAEFLGCQTDELAFTHNCTEAMSFIAGGLELRSGDEVILTDQEHGGGTECWRLREARDGVRVRVVGIPVAPKDPSEITERLVSAIGPKTRVLSFSGITTHTGLMLPSREICSAARDKGVTTVLDGAHMNGQIPVNLSELGCDYFAGSPHKWMFAPAGCGLLYGHGDRLDQLWPSVATGGWANKEGLGAARLMMVGTNNRAVFDGMVAGLRFLKQLGPQTVYNRIHELARLTLRLAQERSYLDVVTPDDDRFFHGMVTIRFRAEDISALTDALRRNNVYVLGGRRLRISTHVHTRSRDIERLFAVCDDVFG